jgi:murein DD-endopeptidase MepM/ murein hydrolase activator NlpD
MKKFLSNIVLLTSLSFVAACEFTQEPAKVEYKLEDYYGYGDIQGPPAQGTKGANLLRDKGLPVQIEDASKEDASYQPPSEIVSEDVPALQSPVAEQVYKVSDNVGPEFEGQKIVKDKVKSVRKQISLSEKNHIVAKSETLFSIARQYNIPILPIIVANSLQPPYALKTGQSLKIPEGKFHEVESGETLYSISRIYGVDMSGIVKLNELKQPYNVVLGQKLQIPFPSDLPSEDVVEETTQESQQQPVEPQQVQQATTQTSAEDSAKPASLRRNTGGVLGEIRTTTDGKVIETKVANNIDTEVETQKLAAQTQEKIKETETADKPVKAEVKKVVEDDGKFAWPLQGKVIKKFGQSGGEYNDGINIAANAGTSVKASNSGRVVYTGNSLKSYGNLVIIKHDNGLLSAYAHLNNVNVKKDQEISKGQTIGTVGSTGKVTSPQLYFAIRKGKTAKNPQDYLK